MAADFLGKGWKFPIAPQISEENQPGPIAASVGESRIQESIWTILSTAPGERVMRPDFGCGIQNLLFQPMSDSLIGKVASEVTRALVLFEPRIDVDGVNVRGDEEDPDVLLIDIDYRIRTTNSRFNLVYPFYVS